MDPDVEGLVAFAGAEPAPSNGVIDVLRLWPLAMDVVNEGRWDPAVSRVLGRGPEPGGGVTCPTRPY